MQTPVCPRPAARGARSRRRALAGVLALLAALATLVLPAAPAAAAPEAGQYVQVAPITVVDNVSIPVGGTTTATVTSVGGVPAAASVSAVAVNGHLQLFAAGAARPVDSTLNDAQGQTTAGFETVPASSSGQISIFSAAATKVIVRLPVWYSVAPAPDGADWAQYYNGPARLGTNDAEPVLTPCTVSGLGQAWAAVAGAPVRSEPAVVGQVVYAAAFNGTVRALDAATGTTIWTVATASGLRASPAVVDGVVYIGASDDRVHAMDAGTGAGVWIIPGGPNACVASDPAVANGVLFHGSSGVLTARNAATGTFLYSDSPTPGRPLSSISSVVVANGAVYAAREALASPGYEPGLTAHHP